MGSEILSYYECLEKKKLHTGKRPFLYSGEAKAAIWTTVNTHTQESMKEGQEADTQ